MATVLIVEDDEAARNALETRLSAVGYRVLAAKDGVEALSLLEAPEVGLVLLDLTLPRLDGYRLLELMQKDPTLREIPVIVTTGASYDRRLASCAAYLKKPFDFHELLHLADQWYTVRRSRRRS